jgi:glycosidase
LKTRPFRAGNTGRGSLLFVTVDRCRPLSTAVDCCRSLSTAVDRCRLQSIAVDGAASGAAPRRRYEFCSICSKGHRITMRVPVFFASLCGLGLLAVACGDANELDSITASSSTPGVAGFDPGTMPPGASGGGASGAGGPGTNSSSTGAPMCPDFSKLCKFEFTYPAGGESAVEVRGDFLINGWTTGLKMSKAADGKSWSVAVPEYLPWAKDVQYKFVVDGNWVTDPVNKATVSNGNGGLNSVLKVGEQTSCADFTCDTSGGGPTKGYDWRDAVLYFVFVDRFLDGNPSNNGSPPSGVQGPASYLGGDWAGVKKKVDEGYFNDLGVNALWLTVPVDNTEGAGSGSDGHQYSAYHGYWPKDVTKPEEHFGALTDLKALVDAAHQKGLKVILDYAMNHVHVSSPLYAQHKDWFWPLSDGSVQNCTCNGGCSWDGPQSKRCWFTDYLPDFNFTNAEARAFSVGNAVQWIKDTGIDGFRLDAVKHVEDAWTLDLRARVTSEIESVTGQHFYMVGETFTGDQGLIKYYVNPKMLDGQFDFPLRARLLRSVLMRAGDAGSTMQALDGFLQANDGYYGAGIMSTFVGNHDVPRPIHFAQDNPLWGTGTNVEWADGKDRAWSNTPGLPGGTSAFERLANAFTILFTSKGVPLVYYGDEVAMPGGGDPDNRRMMQWSGYSAGQTLVYKHVKALAAIRKAHAALRRGARSSVWSDEGALAYKMTTAGDTVYVVVNRSDATKTVSGLPNGALKNELTSATVSGPSVSVPPRSSMILVSP